MGLGRLFPIMISATVCAAVLFPSVLFAQACDGEQKTTTPAPPVNSDKQDLYLKQLKYAVSSDVDLILVGDSLAEFWDTDTLLPLRVVNLGVAGDGTQHVLWRLASPEWSKLRPRNVLIMLGTNNMAWGDKPCAIIAGLVKVIERVASIWPSAQIGFLEITPRGQGFLDYNDIRMQINAAIRRVPGIKKINVDDEITCGWQKGGSETCPNYTTGNVHFSSSGYGVILKSAKSVLFGK